MDKIRQNWLNETERTDETNRMDRCKLTDIERNYDGRRRMTDIERNYDGRRRMTDNNYNERR
jgi:hypothetical protein